LGGTDMAQQELLWKLVLRRGRSNGIAMHNVIRTQAVSIPSVQ
jgi:hypothetical protein